MLSAFLSHSALHFDFGVEQACSAAARVLLASPSRASPSSASSCLAFLPYEAFPHAEERRQRIRVFCGSALPSSGPTSPFLSSSMRMQYLLRGGRTCFPDRDCRRLPASHCISRRSCLPVPRSLFIPGRSDVFPDRDCVPLPVHCCIALSFHLLPFQVVRAWPGGALFSGVAGLVTSFEARKVVLQSRTGWCCLVSTRLNPTKTSQATRVSPLHV